MCYSAYQAIVIKYILLIKTQEHFEIQFNYKEISKWKAVKRWKLILIIIIIIKIAK
jgi:hypothetical protein